MMIDEVKANIEKGSLEQTYFDDEIYFKIQNVQSLRPFFMSIVSDSNHWMFISSNGGITAGRKNAEYALFPYYTDDKITFNNEFTGSKSIFQVYRNSEKYVWEPFSIRHDIGYDFTRNLYKSKFGNKIIFEEINRKLNLIFRYKWCNSNQFGFVRHSEILNISDDEVKIEVLDGIQDILPSGVPSDLQNNASNLVNAYRRSELDVKTGIGIFALSAIIVDKAEPSEALSANIVWSFGLSHPKYLLSSRQLDAFRNWKLIVEEKDVKGEVGAYFINSSIILNAYESKKWSIVADVHQDHNGIALLQHLLSNNSHIPEEVEKDIELGTLKLIKLNASADAMQCTQDKLKDSRHYTNVLFNNMRGGIFDDNYNIDKQDLISYLKNANKSLWEREYEFIKNLPIKLDLYSLQEALKNKADYDLNRLMNEYMPLKFSRRHGDPSRPWNKFSINTINEIDGSKVLDYEGNWRDIFQNWEALVHSFPDFIEAMIFRFLNASTFDGYNPYRVTKGGFDWETIEPDDPWSYIGYWGDHQIIYLLKFLEFIEKYQPGKLSSYFNQNLFVYANVPYKIKPYQEILTNPKDTIEFDENADIDIRKAVTEIGADGALLQNASYSVCRVNFIEKSLATLLAKLSNYIPEGGVWMNTQRPEWNDANNALVGNGISMVTLYYIRRYLSFFINLMEGTSKSVNISVELAEYYFEIKKVFENHLTIAQAGFTDVSRKAMVDALGMAASHYRTQIYSKSFTGEKTAIYLAEILAFFAIVLKHIDYSISVNKRQDGLFHAYNLLSIGENGMSISNLSEMLEGQVAVLSSGYLSAKENLEVLDALKKSNLYRADQDSYILYPDKELPGFLEKNTIPEDKFEASELLKKLLANGDSSLVKKDIFGKYHFHSSFRNVSDLKQALMLLDEDIYSEVPDHEIQAIFNIYESVFNHKAFTGRSGTFFGYEGLGSIYWHMVSKLLLATQECCLQAINNGSSQETIDRLVNHYYEISEGLGVHKAPELYGAFPTDPYSHTPANKGVQQPGMTGQVKEDIISRFGELGIVTNNGCLGFNPVLLREEEFLEDDCVFNYIDTNGDEKSLKLRQNNLGFTYCQVPIQYIQGEQSKIRVYFSDGQSSEIESNMLDKELSKNVFARNGKIERIEVTVDKNILK